MQNIALLLLCLASGILLRRFRKVPENAHVGLNGIIINLALPALILSEIHQIDVGWNALYSISVPWALFIVGMTGFFCLSRLLAWPPATTGALILTGCLGNTSFMGLPMIEAFYGKSGLPIGIMIDQLGTYLALGTVGITIACMCSGGRADLETIAKRIVTFLPLIALIFAAALNSVSYPFWISDALTRLGGTVAPLALISIGLQIRLHRLENLKLPLLLGLTYKLIVGPALLVLVYFGALKWNGLNMRVTMFEAAMGPQIGAAIVATQYGLDAALVTMMVGVGTIMAFATLPAWWKVLAIF